MEFMLNQTTVFIWQVSVEVFIIMIFNLTPFLLLPSVTENQRTMIKVCF